MVEWMVTLRQTIPGPNINLRKATRSARVALEPPLFCSGVMNLVDDLGLAAALAIGALDLLSASGLLCGVLGDLLQAQS
jgi:hypothetical protein